METHPEFHENILAFPSALNLRRFSLAWTKVSLVLADICSMILSIWLAQGLFQLLNPEWKGSGYLILEPSLIVFGTTYILVGHYRSRYVNQVEELRHLTITTSMIFLTLFAFNELTGETKYPAIIFGLSWSFAIVALPLSRIIIRWLGANLGIWGEPVVIVGNGSLSRKLVHYLLKNTYCGMRPVLVIDGLPHVPVDSAKDMPVPIMSLEKWPSPSEIGCLMGVNTAIIVAPDLPSHVSETIARGEHLGFSNIITVTKQFNTRNFGLRPLDFGGVLGFEERHYELNVLEDRLIRFFDLFLIFSALPILAPFLICIIAAIRLDSAGSVFYRQTRIGKGGREFKVLKFRTMVQDADKVLLKYLEENPKLLAEWNADHKLKDDPRITRIGKILRKASLDELPQLWNVLKGEMSLIGPRPIVNEEIERYGDRFKYYAQVPPGLSGLWQVSGRNDIGYEERVSLDEYYVRNRSIWLNVHIIIRTSLAVIRRQGAY
jgi:Undecaprenyl-phosphate galactose phosphotransferase WbaP